MSDGISAHGTLIARQASGSGAFTTVAEVKDISLPAFMRNAIELTGQADNDDQYVVGLRRKGEFGFKINLIPTDGSHDESTGLIHSYLNGLRDGWRVTFPDSTILIFSGYLTNMPITAPVDGALEADITIRPTGAVAITPGA